MTKNKGFTLIELLIVIAVLGILIVAILSAIDPLEQIRKARDSGRKSDSAELLGAYERYYSTFQCYPWDTGAPDCSNVTAASRTVPEVPDFAGVDLDLVTQGELKSQFGNRNTIANSEIWASEDSTTRQVSICYEPESKTGRQGGFGPLRDQTNSTDVTACTGTYPDDSCYVCVPQ